MKWSNFSTKQKVLMVIAFSVFLIASVVMKNQDDQQKAELAIAPTPATTILEKWSYGDSHNIAVLVADSSKLNTNTAKEIVTNECPNGCSNAYFYASKEAYDLHAYKRTKFGLNSEYSNDPKKLAAMEREWKKADNNWKTIKDNLIATVSFGEYQAYPYRDEID